MYEVLNKLNIKCDEVEHNRVYTIEDAKIAEISSKISGVECKNLFIKSKTKYYLVLVKANSRVDLKLLSKILNEKRLTFASIEELKEILNLDIGTVTPMGIINDTNNLVTLLIDNNLKNNKVLVHPNVNTKTLSIYYDDLINYIEYLNHKYINF